MNSKNIRKITLISLDTIIMILTSAFVFIYLYVEKILIYTPSHIYKYIIVFILIELTTNIILKIYDNLWRYAESKEYLFLLLSTFIGCFVFVLIDLFLLRNNLSVLVAITISNFSMLCMLILRFSYRILRAHIKSVNNTDSNKIPLIIIGAGSVGVRLHEEIQNNKNFKYKTRCFLDDSKDKIGKFIHGIEIKGDISILEKLLKSEKGTEVIIAIPTLSSEKRKNIYDICFNQNHRVRMITNTINMIDNVYKNVRDIEITDLLGREPVLFDNSDIRSFIKNNVVVVTGGGGSIGSELCRQIMFLQPKKLIIIDIYENNVYDIQQEINYKHKNNNLIVEIANVREYEKIDFLFGKYKPDIVFHAAAHKHVPLMEDCPEEAIKNNIFGTYNLVRASDKWNVKKFVLISTDKAVNPTNIMGATKRFCEMIIQSMKNVSSTEFVAVRFGNVLGSNGSVIPLFLSQIEHGGPVTITDKRIIRYFMTIQEAAQLVLQAGAMASNSDIFVLDMGQPVKIIELAENLIKLKGYIPYIEIPIVETGLRKGEKLYEELLVNGGLLSTQNKKIFIDKHDFVSKKEIESYLDIISKYLEDEKFDEIKELMKTIVPTYKDANEINEFIDSDDIYQLQTTQKNELAIL